jgi:murein DD-endopeptidase MepM/ murein hydrolase activator NlpD
MQDTGLVRYLYFQYLEDCNDLGAGGVQAWLFYPGMLFGSREKWWPDTGVRPTAHEGLDICYFTDGSGRGLQLDSGSKVPVMSAGTVIAICEDFLGRSVFLEHKRDGLISVYAHIVPLRTVGPGYMAGAGEVIGSVADTAGRKNRMPAHLHVTIMNLPPDPSAVHFDWKFICRSGRVTLFDPLEIIACPSYRILPGING